MFVTVEERKAPLLMAMKGVPNELSNMATWEIRVAIAELVKQNKMNLAVAAAESALALYPESQDILVISSLLAEVSQDWARAEHLLIQLLQVQGSEAPAESWLHLIRVLRCQNKTDDMSFVIDHVLNIYTSDPSVISEREALLALKVDAEQNKA